MMHPLITHGVLASSNAISSDSGPVSPTDPYWANVVALLHFNGADGSTTFTDETGKIWTAGADAQIDTAQSKLGGSSGLFDGTADRVTTPDHADFAFGTGNFTIEMFIRVPNVTGVKGLFTKRNLTSQYAPYNLFLNNATLRLFVSTTGTSWTFNIDSSTAIAANTWYHVAAVRNGTAFNLYLDGTSVASTTNSGSLVANAYTVALGAGTSAGDNADNGWIDELRVTKGIARYTSNFTPPTEEFPNQ